MAPNTTNGLVSRGDRSWNEVFDDSESASEGQESLIKHTKFQVTFEGKKTETYDGFLQAYRQMGSSRQIALLKTVSSDLNAKIGKEEDLIIKFNRFLRDECAAKDLDADELLSSYDNFTNRVRAIEVGRDKKTEGHKRITRGIHCKRGQVFQQFHLGCCDSVRSTRQMGNILKACEPNAFAIQVLNHFIVQAANQTKNTSNSARLRRFSGLSPTVINNAHIAITEKNSKWKWRNQIAIPDRGLLNRLDLKVSSCGLFVLKEHFDPNQGKGVEFDDEDQTWEFVAVEGKSAEKSASATPEPGLRMNESPDNEADEPSNDTPAAKENPPPTEALPVDKVSTLLIRPPSSTSSTISNISTISTNSFTSTMRTMPEISPESSSTSRSSANHPNGPSKSEPPPPPPAPQPVTSLFDNLGDLRFETTHRLDALETSDSARGLRLDYHDTQLEQLAKKACDLKVQVTRLVSLNEECAAKLKALESQIDEEGGRRSGGRENYTGSAASLVHEAHRARLEDLERRMEKGSQVISAVAAAILGLEEQVQAADEMRKLIFESVAELEAELPAIKTAVTELDVKTEEGLAQLDQKVTKLDDDSNLYLEALNDLGQRYNQLDLAVEALERHNETGRDSHEDVAAVEARIESLKTAQDEILATHDTLVQNHAAINDRLERVESWCDNALQYDTAMESRISELEVARVETKSAAKNLLRDQKSLRIRLDQVEQGEQDLKAATESIPAIDSRLGDLEASKTQVLSDNEKLDQNQNSLRKRIETVEIACLSQLKRIDKMQECITTTINSMENMNGQLGDHTKHIETIRGKYKHIATWYKYFDEVTKTQKVLIEELQAEANRQRESDVAFKLDIESRIKQLIKDNQTREDSMMDRIKALECRDKSLSSELVALKHLRASSEKRNGRDSTETPPHAKRPRRF